MAHLPTGPMPTGSTEPSRLTTLLRVAVLCLAMSVSFDPHLLVLSWSSDRREALAATNLATCTQAMMAISEGRWLADDPPTGMQCVPGNGFSARALCIEGFNCEEDGNAADR